jgi:hypothetical protein
MKRHLSRRRWAMMLAACAMPALCSAAGDASVNGRYIEYSVARSWAVTLRDSLQGAQANVVPAAPTANYFGDVPFNVIGVYGATMLDMLSAGPLVLVRWPDGCCTSKQRWHTRNTRRATGSTPDNVDSNSAHIFFLWPES